MNRQIQTLRGINFFYYAQNAILLPYLPLFFKLRDYSSLQIGFLMMIGPFITIFSQPMWGYLSDRFSTIKKIILILWILTVIASVGLFLTQGFLSSFIFALLLYFFMLPSTPLLDSMVIKSTSERGVSYGSIRWWGSLGFSSTALISGFLLIWIGGVGHIALLYWFIWIVPLILVFFLKDEKTKRQRLSFQSLRLILHNKSFLWFLFLVFILIIPHRMNDSLLGIYLKELGASDHMVGWAWALAALSEIPTFAILSRYLYRYHELALLGFVALLYTIRWLVYGLVHDPWILIFMQLSHSVTFAIFWLASVQYTIRVVPAQLRSTGQALLSAVFLGLAGITGGTFGGWIEDRWGGSDMYFFGAALTMIASILLFGTRWMKRRKNNEKDALLE